MWFSLVCTLIDNEYGQWSNIVDSQYQMTKEMFVKICWQLKTRTRYTMQMSYLIHQTCLSKTLFIPGIWAVSGLVIVKNKLTSVFCASVFLLKINFVITLSKFAAEPLTRGSQSIRGQTNKNWYQFVKFPFFEIDSPNLYFMVNCLESGFSRSLSNFGIL